MKRKVRIQAPATVQLQIRRLTFLHVNVIPNSSGTSVSRRIPKELSVTKVD